MALITANPGSGLHTLVQQHRIGLVVNAEDQEALNEGIRLAVGEEEAREVTQQARAYAAEHLSIGRVMRRFEEYVVQRNY